MTGEILCIYGPARSGKDAFAEVFYQGGYVKQSPGMYIKAFYDPFTSGEIGIPEMRDRIIAANPELTYENVWLFCEAYLQPFDDLSENISAFTEDLVDKEKLRAILEIGGEVVYDHIFGQYLAAVDVLLAQGKDVLNPRVATRRETLEMITRKAWFFRVYRPGYAPVSQWETESIGSIEGALAEASVYPVCVENDATLEALTTKARRYLVGMEGK